ncbi:hypothetical protein [Alteromonas sp.]|uniref:hypothetical protein n=1 Tax=Alteromonas sp. TaxID=232 RepID=UPI003514AE3D
MNIIDRKYFELLTHGWEIVSKVPRDRVERLVEQPAGLANTLEKRWGFDPATKYIATDKAICIFKTELTKNQFARFFFPGVVNAYGNTRNNIREFLFLENLFPSINIVNTAKYTHSVLTEEQYEIMPLEEISKLFQEYMESSRQISALELNTIVHFTSAFNSWIFANSLSATKSIPLALVANDHAPFQVAFSQAARFFNIPTLYIQHAEVTDHFPPLHFDYAILRNDKSRDVYYSLGESATETFVIPREAGVFEHDKLITEKVDPVCCFYLTANYFIDDVKKVCVKLKTNPYINRLIIKVHPRTNPTDIENLSSLLDLEVFATLDRQPDIAISQNSAVVTELLHQGVPTYYLGGTDWLPFDYYGYVKDRIVESISLEDTDEKFWDVSFFDYSWKQRYEKWNPKAGIEYKRDHAKIAQLFERLAKECLSVTESRGLFGWFAACKTHAKSSSILSEILKLGAAPRNYFLEKCPTTASDNEVMDIVACLDKLHALRLPQVIEIYRASLSSETCGTLELILKIKASEWLYEDLSPEFYEVLVERLHLFKKNRKLLGFFENSLFNFYVGRGEVEKCFLLFKNAKIISLEKLHINKKIGLVNKIFSNGLQFEYKESLTVLEKSCNQYQLFKLQALTPINSFENKHQVTTQAIKDCISQTLFGEFEKSVLRVYSRRAEQLRFMDVRWSSKEADALLGLIESAIENKSPFSFVRISEGEGYLFSETQDFMTADDLDNRERHWWGEELDFATREKVLFLNRGALISADVIGIPSIYRFIRDSREGAESLTENLIQRGLLNALNGVDSVSSKSCLFTEEKGNIPLFLNFHNMKKIFNAAQRVVFISSMTKEILSTILDIPFCLVNIPTHNRTLSNNKYSSFEKPLPYVLEEKLKELERLTEPGTLVLVSAGVAGKCFLSAAKDKGAVALDVGGAIDFWFRDSKLAY